MDKNKKKLLTTSEAATLLCVSPDTVLKWVKSGKIKSHRTLGGHFRIACEDLQVPALDDKSPDDSDMIPLRKPAAYQYCWEYLSRNNKIQPECKECITYRSRASRCYELRLLSQETGCLGLCKSTCEDCNYYKLIHGKCLRILIFSEDPRILSNKERLEENKSLEVRFSTSEYEISSTIEKFRPDYMVVDCMLGKKRINTFCKSVYDDFRIPVPRIILASKRKKDDEYCEREIFAWIKKPFTVEQIAACIGDLLKE